MLPGTKNSVRKTASYFVKKYYSKFRKYDDSLEFFLNGAELSLNSGNLINHWSMNWARFKDPVSHMCLSGTVVAFWSLTQEVAGLSPFTTMTNIFVNKFAEFSKNI